MEPSNMGQTLGYAEALACVTRVYRSLDANDGAALAGCFTPEATWRRSDGDLQGWDEIQAMADARDSARTTAHVVGNLDLESSGDQWIARYYLTVYAGREGVGQLAGILACEDRLVLTEAGARVAEKRSQSLLRPGG
jgi:hypothetical protein